ncbi:MAG: alpha/beta hydrolase [Myxococcaceae bacterium]|nr:alpha/beta hydrolase [Myxococcaceae bacterium]
MTRSATRLLLLPGMDGTGELFAPFAAEVSSWATVQIARYPLRSPCSMDALVAALELDAPVTLVAESFSTAVGIRFATQRPELVERLVLVGSFVTPPLGATLLRAFGRVPFLIAPPRWAVRTFLTGTGSSDALIDTVRQALSRVAPEVLADRLAQLSRLDERERLRALQMPIMTVSARQDRLVSASVTAELRAARPDARHVDLDAPHLILQARPGPAAALVRTFVGA